jgi:hypothetical protein
MALDLLTPTIWASNLLSPLYKRLVWGALANRDYEGDISSVGDSVKINEIGDITISTYTKSPLSGSTSTALSWQVLTAAQKMLVIDQTADFAFAIDNVDSLQNKPNVMAEAMARAGYGIADAIDQYVSGIVAHGAGKVITAATVSSGSALSLLSAMKRELDEKNVPNEGRFVVVPPFFHQDLLENVTGSVSTSTAVKSYDSGYLVNGYVGSLYGFEILMSNNCHTSAGTIICAFNRSAVTYAGQLSQIKYVERESYFDQGVKGLYLYGAKVVRPNAIVVCDVTEG